MTAIPSWLAACKSDFFPSPSRCRQAKALRHRKIERQLHESEVMIRASGLASQHLDFIEIDIIALALSRSKRVPGCNSVIAYTADVHLLLESFKRFSQPRPKHFARHFREL